MADGAFRDRADAGRRLASKLVEYATDRPVVLALPRGGVPVGAEIAAALRAPLDVVLVRKVGVPGQPELGMGAIGERGVRVVNDEVLAIAGVSAAAFAQVETRERAELERRARRYRDDGAPISVEGRDVILVDDGVATGATALAAITVVRELGARRIVFAAPVAPPETIATLEGHADRVVVLVAPARMWAIGAWYQNFTQTTDDEVVAALAINRDGTNPS